MPDTGEDREIKQRVNAKEALRVAQSKKLLVKTKKDNSTARPFAKSEKVAKPKADKNMPGKKQRV
ncbi:MAG: hypothetical protein WAN69_17920 [Candidatus Korobacteraceae bacterium]